MMHIPLFWIGPTMSKRSIMENLENWIKIKKLKNYI